MNVPDHEQLDLLISRIADGEAGTQDWEAFGAIAERDPAAWKLLAQAQHDHGALSVAVGVALHAADRVELPSHDAVAAYTGRYGEASPGRARIGSLRGWGGWAAAACVAIAWVSGGNFGRPPVVGGTNGASVIPAGYTINNADDAVKAYLDVGKKQNMVLGELPQRLLVESRPGNNGQVEVIYVRQFVERAEVANLTRFAQDESGRPVPVRVAMPKAQGLPD